MVTEKQIAESLDLTEEEMEKAKKMSARTFITVPAPKEEKAGQHGEAVELVVAETLPKKMDTKYGRVPYLEVIDSDGRERLLVIASKSARMQYRKLLDKNNNDLENEKILVWKEYYSHEDHGTTLSWKMQLLADDSDRVSEQESDTDTASKLEEETKLEKEKMETKEEREKKREEVKAFM